MFYICQVRKKSIKKHPIVSQVQHRFDKKLFKSLYFLLFLARKPFWAVFWSTSGRDEISSSVAVIRQSSLVYLHLLHVLHYVGPIQIISMQSIFYQTEDNNENSD